MCLRPPIGEKKCIFLTKNLHMSEKSRIFAELMRECALARTNIIV